MKRVPAHRLSALHPTWIWWVGNANLPPQERGHCKCLALFISSEPKESFSFQVQVKSTDPEICSYVIERKISKGPNVWKFSKIFQTKAAIEQRFKKKVLWLQTEYKLQISSSYFIWTSSWDQTHLSGNKRYEDKLERKKKFQGKPLMYYFPCDPSMGGLRQTLYPKDELRYPRLPNLGLSAIRHRSIPWEWL